jgi:DNA repair exonuclease SbcCD ATPase subunit
MLAGPVAHAADSEVDQLRDQLRATVLQLRQLQDQQAAAPPPVAAPPSDDLTRKLAAAQAQLRTARREAAKAAALQEAVDRAQADNATLLTQAAASAAALAAARTDYAQADERARNLAAERDGLKAQLARVTLVATACQAKNERLTEFGRSMLTAYQRLTFRQMGAAREPLLGLKRVELETIAQEREDKIYDNHCDPRLDAAAPAKGAGH